MSLNLRPISFNAAKKWVGEHHRHSSMPNGWKFGAAIYDNERMCGVVMCKPPTARMLDDGFTLEIQRLCTDGTRNACSFAYASMVRVAKELGYKRVVTYTREEESGSSLKAVGFQCVAGGIAEDWSRRWGPRNNVAGTPRLRWELQWAEIPTMADERERLFAV